MLLHLDTYWLSPVSTICWDCEGILIVISYLICVPRYKQFVVNFFKRNIVSPILVTNAGTTTYS